MEIKKEDVTKLILQYLRENGYNKSFMTLSEESNVTLNIMDQQEDFKNDIETGKWDRVLKQLTRVRLQKQKQMDLYEIIICELLEINERETALQLLNELIKGQGLHEIFEERYLRLDYMIRKPGEVDKLQLYTDTHTKEKRRFMLAQSIIDELINPPPSRLLQLLGNALRFQYENKNISQMDLFLGIVQDVQEKHDKVIQRVAKIVRYSEKMRIETAKFSPDGQHLITGSVDGILEVWDAATFKVRTDLPYQVADQFMTHTSPIIDMSFSSDSELFASIDTGCTKIWRFQTGKLLKKIDNTHGRALHCVQFSGDPQDLLIASQDVHVINLKSSSTIKTFRGHQGSVNQMCLSQQNSQLYTCSDDTTVRVWDYSSQECVFQYKSDAAVIQIFRGIIDQKTFLICPRSRTLVLVNAAMNVVKMYVIPNEIVGEYVSCGISAKGALVYGLTSSGILICFDIGSGAVRKQAEQKLDQIVFHPKRNIAFGFTGRGELHFLKS